MLGLKVAAKQLFQITSFSRIIWKTNVSNKSIYITFDDGPNSNTNIILDILLKLNAKATFFVVGTEVDKFKSILIRVLNEGHSIGLHGMTHQKSKQIGVVNYIHEMLDLRKKILDILPQSKPCFMIRPPYGELSFIPTILLILMRFKIVMWTHDSNDSYAAISNDILDGIKKLSLNAGDILLFHDDYEKTSEALSEVILNIQSRGYSCEKL